MHSLMGALIESSCLQILKVLLLESANNHSLSLSSSFNLELLEKNTNDLIYTEKSITYYHYSSVFLSLYLHIYLWIRQVLFWFMVSVDY